MVSSTYRVVVYVLSRWICLIAVQELGNQVPDLLEAATSPRAEPENLDDIQPSPVYVEQSDVASACPGSPKLSPKPSPKMSKPIPKPSNPLEAAMFKQLFPEQPKVVVKKSLSEMQAEGGSRPSGVSPAMTRRDSRTCDADSGLCTFRHDVTHWLGEHLISLFVDLYHLPLVHPSD